jgi:hypothetical protein
MNEYVIVFLIGLAVFLAGVGIFDVLGAMFRSRNETHSTPGVVIGRPYEGDK